MLDGVSLEAFHGAVNRVAPSLIRVEADEATYNLHIILRFELEKKLFTGELAVTDLPTAWRGRISVTQNPRAFNHPRDRCAPRGHDGVCPARQQPYLAPKAFRSLLGQRGARRQLADAGAGSPPCAASHTRPDQPPNAPDAAADVSRSGLPARNRGSRSPRETQVFHLPVLKNGIGADA